MSSSPKKLRNLANGVPHAAQNGHTKQEANGHIANGGVVVRQKRAPIFEYPALPTAEILLYLIILCSALGYGWYRIYQVSQTYIFGQGGWGRYEMTDLPYFGKRKKDITNYEWLAMVPLLTKLLPIFVGHCLVFNLTGAFFGPKSRHISEFMTLIYGIGACCNVFSAKTVWFSTIQGTFIYTITRVIKRKPAVWGAVIPMLYLTLHNPFDRPQNYTDYLTPFFNLLFLSYKLLGYIGYNLEHLNGKTRKRDAPFINGLYRMFFFTFYLPYLTSLIVLYPSFEKQIEERSKRVRDWFDIIKHAIRICFWFCFIQFILHFFYFEAILTDVQTLQAMKKDALTAFGYATGTFFHLKYVVIFGFPSLFAKIDKMQPLPGPICIQRVALYSKIWRGFDRGLYHFFKEYIFLPICRPTFSIPRKLFGIVISYGFVLVWHGITHQYIVWIVLNVLELLQESIAKTVYLIPPVKNFREKYISDRMFRRILAWVQILPFAFALYSNFYFLAGSATGYVFVERIFWQETVPLKLPFFYLWGIGYCYMNCCMECERRESEREKRKALEDAAKKDL